MYSQRINPINKGSLAVFEFTTSREILNIQIHSHVVY